MGKTRRDLVMGEKATIRMPGKVEGTCTGQELLARTWNRHHQNDSEIVEVLIAIHALFNRPKPPFIVIRVAVPCGRKLVLPTLATAVRFLVGGGGSGRILGMCRAPFGFMYACIGVCRAKIMRGSSVREEARYQLCHVTLMSERFKHAKERPDVSPPV